ncbi:hypothetical protein M9H77_03040 [Catharanthus roseus]|uniref:Uncharacterized protein n=1 Tax=Catharanthus roseus TaxID=4058 RepID=A0ACC0CA97_CATRO|nr:hypothetical protein M9H77_03040 [Catharanthus roseus]
MEERGKIISNPPKFFKCNGVGHYASSCQTKRALIFREDLNGWIENEEDESGECVEGEENDLGVVAYTCIAASADYECLGRPSCSSWCYMFVWLPYLDRALVLSDLWRAEVPLICYEIVEYHYPWRVMC